MPAILSTQWNVFLELVESVLDSEWTKMLRDLENDEVHDGITYLGFRCAPAAKANHHARLGGLVEHLMEMWNIYKGMDRSLFNCDALINDRRILAGIILHDLHKGWAHFVESPTTPSGVDYGGHPSSRLLRPDQKSMYIASRYLRLDMLQQNAMYHSEGGWADGPPKWSSILAKTLYLLDELSSNVLDRASSTGYGDLFAFGDRGVTTRLAANFNLRRL